MVTKLTLWVLPFLLFFLMNRHGISGRDLKVELQDHTDTNSQSYINHITTSDTTQPNYKASTKHNHEKHNEPYITNNIKPTSDSKHNHPSDLHNRNADQPYITSYATSSVHDANKLIYLIGYKTGAHGSDKDLSLRSTNKAYITGYTTTPRDAKEDQKESRYGTDKSYITQYGGDTNFKGDSNTPYITQYGSDVTPSKRDSYAPYITQYGDNVGLKRDSYASYITQYGDGVGPKRDSNSPYITQYGGDARSKEDSNAPYITQYGDDVGVKRDSNEPYITQYGNDIGSKEDSNAPYITQYGGDARSKGDSNAPYITQYGNDVDSKKNSNAPYITQYGGDAHSKGDSNAPYIIQYGDDVSAKRDSNAPYITQYGGDARSKGDSKASYITQYGDDVGAKRDSNAPYITQYGNDVDSKEDSNAPYITQYGGDARSKGDSNAPYIVQYGDDIGAKRYSNVPYITQYGNDIGSKEDSNAPYITQYGGDARSKGDSNAPYITQYGNDVGSKKNSNAPYITQYGDAHSKGDSNAPYITQYGDDVGPKRNSNTLYITQYGGESSGSNKEIKTKSATAQDSAKPYVTNYGLHSKKTQGLKRGPPSSSVDHTEAFKVGFFAMDDLYIGNIMTLQFPVEDFSHFLSKKEADSIPFSIPQLPSVLQLFSISEDSAQAKSMRATIEQCEAGTITGETKICANSLESMLEFVHNIIGAEEKHNIHTTSPSSGAPLQKYTILKISEDIYAPKWVACHPLPYPYGVYYCHFISTGTRVFKVLLDGENGDKVEALGVCHLDTSDWSPNHILFKQLGFMPGEAPVCHFFPVKHLMWVPQPSTATM